MILGGENWPRNIGHVWLLFFHADEVDGTNQATVTRDTIPLCLCQLQKTGKREKAIPLQSAASATT